ncbi:hypothetical protein VTL71DRAFT_5193 [Oculimacula yallundae]|uniref:Uncharacterized protein n=1 Tax=Oculimacula yallundae TaxID=86028 RepID=A0ABR4C0F0_9HELO
MKHASTVSDRTSEPELEDSEIHGDGLSIYDSEVRRVERDNEHRWMRVADLDSEIGWERRSIGPDSSISQAPVPRGTEIAYAGRATGNRRHPGRHGPIIVGANPAADRVWQESPPPGTRIFVIYMTETDIAARQQPIIRVRDSGGGSRDFRVPITTEVLLARRESLESREDRLLIRLREWEDRARHLEGRLRQLDEATRPLLSREPVGRPRSRESVIRSRSIENAEPVRCDHCGAVDHSTGECREGRDTPPSER